MRDLIRRLEKIEEHVKVHVIPQDCICHAEPIKLVALNEGEPLPQVNDCPAHPERIRMIVVCGMTAPNVVARRFAEGIDYRGSGNA
jgi:hypothetical protein